MKLSNTTSYTVLETFIAIVLIIIIILVFSASFLSAFNYLRRIIELRTVSLILQEKVSEVRNLDFFSINTLGANYYSPGMSSLDGAVGTVTQSLNNGESEIIKITFGVRWTTFDGKPGYKTLTTLMTDHGINKQ
jgi:hypothetical protein